MDEFFRTSENQRYSETYRSREYNRTEESYVASESFRAAEINSVESSSFSSSSRSDDRKKTAKRKLLSGTVMLPAVGTVAGATLIFAAVVAVIKVALLSLVVSAGAISAAFSVENLGDATLTAYLVGGGESYSQPLLQSDDKHLVDFRLLDPDTEYFLDVRDGDGKPQLTSDCKPSEKHDGEHALAVFVRCNRHAEINPESASESARFPQFLCTNIFYVYL